MVGEFGETEYFGEVPSMILDLFETRVWGVLCESVGGLKKDLESIGLDTARVFGVYAEYVEDVFVTYVLSQVTKLPEAVCVSKTATCPEPREEYTEKRLQEVHGEVEEVVKRADAVMQINRMLEDEARETNSETVFFRPDRELDSSAVPEHCVAGKHVAYRGQGRGDEGRAGAGDCKLQDTQGKYFVEEPERDKSGPGQQERDRQGEHA
eukprot:Polyplicarium_translucidae@DN3215_c0_g2_i1.p2